MLEDVFRVALALPDRSTVIIHNKTNTIHHSIFADNKIRKRLGNGHLGYFQGFFINGRIDLGKRLIDQEWY